MVLFITVNVKIELNRSCYFPHYRLCVLKYFYFSRIILNGIHGSLECPLYMNNHRSVHKHLDSNLITDRACGYYNSKHLLHMPQDGIRVPLIDVYILS